MELTVPNESCNQLREFILDLNRNCEGDCLWGGECNAFLAKVDQVEDLIKKPLSSLFVHHLQFCMANQSGFLSC